MEGQRYSDVRVECYAGYRGEQEPRRFHLPGAGDGDRPVVEVRDILDRWLDPEHRYFKVLGSDGLVHMLRHDERSGRWSLRTLGPDAAGGGG